MSAVILEFPGRRRPVPRKAKRRVRVSRPEKPLSPEPAAKDDLDVLAEAFVNAGLGFRREGGVVTICPGGPWREYKDEAKAWAEIALYNGWTKAERARWHEVSGSARPASAVAAFRAANAQAEESVAPA